MLADGTPVHVKKVERSAPASHLIAQALISTESLWRDLEARAALSRRAGKLGRTDLGEGFRPDNVVLAVYRPKRLITAADLFTFTKVNLVNHDAILRNLGTTLHVAAIPWK